MSNLNLQVVVDRLVADDQLYKSLNELREIAEDTDRLLNELDESLVEANAVFERLEKLL